MVKLAIFSMPTFYHPPRVRARGERKVGILRTKERIEYAGTRRGMLSGVSCAALRGQGSRNWCLKYVGTSSIISLIYAEAAPQGGAGR